MPFTVSWNNLLDQLEDLPEGAELVTPLSNKRFRVTDVQEHRVVIKIIDSDESRPLQRDQFETLFRRITDEPDGFELDRLPPDADPYPAVLSLHPRFEVDENQGIIRETEAPTSSLVVDQGKPDHEAERTEPDVSVYSDALLLIDALERHELDAVQDLETDSLVNLYTLLSDVQRNANDLRQQIASVLLDRLHHDRPVAGQFGSVQRTTRRNRSLKDDEEVLEILEEEGVDTDRVLSVDRDKLDQVLDVTTIPESEVYEIDESEYVRKAEVDEEVKETRLQGLKDRLATSDDPEAEELREEIEELEGRIEELTEFKSGQVFHTQSGAEP